MFCSRTSGFIRKTGTIFRTKMAVLLRNAKLSSLSVVGIWSHGNFYNYRHRSKLLLSLLSRDKRRIWMVGGAAADKH